MYKIVFFGTSSSSALVLARLIDFCHEQGSSSSASFIIQAVVTQPDRPVPSPVAQTAEKFKIPVLKPEILNEDFIKNNLSLLESDLFILVSYGKLLPEKLLNIPKFGALNIHPSLLPKYRGPSPMPAALLNGDKTSGVTIIKMDKEMDHGSILITKEISLLDSDTFETLSTKLFGAGAELLIKIIPDFVMGKVKLIPQNDEQATITHLIKKEDGYFDISNPPSPEKLDRMIRAYYPWPTTWAKWNGKIVKFLPSSSHPEGATRLKDLSTGLRPTCVGDSSGSMTHQNDKFLVQMEGKKPMPLESFLHGYPNFPSFFLRQ